MGYPRAAGSRPRRGALAAAAATAGLDDVESLLEQLFELLDRAALQHEAGGGGLAALVDAVEAMLLAESDAERHTAAESFGTHLFALSGGTEAGARRWGLLWGAGIVEAETDARRLLDEAKNCAAPAPRHFGGNRALLMLDRCAGSIARHDGKRDLRGEGLLLLRIGLFGR